MNNATLGWRLRLALCVFTSIAVATSIVDVPRAQAGFHLWTLQEIYSNSSGSLQFIELVDNSGGGQEFTGFTTLNVYSDLAHTQTHSFTFPSNVSANDSNGHTMLLGTAGLQAAGGPAPDFIIPPNFL